MAMILDKQSRKTTLDVASEQAASGKNAWSLTTSPPGLNAGGKLLRVATTRFGTLEVEADLILTLPDGLIGFKDSRRYVIVRQDEDSEFRWLQSLDAPSMALPIVEPGEFRPDYAPILSDADARALELTEETPKLVFVIVTVPPHDPRAMTANLLAPLVINGLTRQGKQVIVQNEEYTTRHAIMEELRRAAALGAAVTVAPRPCEVEQAA